MEWYEQCTVFWTWSRHGRPMTRDWVRESVIERAQEMSAEAIIFGVQLGGHVAYRSDLAPPVPDMENDILAQLCEDGHARGLKIITKWVATTGGNAVQALEHPDWLNVDWEGKRRALLCYSSPFGDFAESQAREMLATYPVDGIFYDSLNAGKHDRSTCYCVYCQEEFRRTYDTEMPRSPDRSASLEQPLLDDPVETQLMRDFQTRAARNHCRRIRRAIDEVRPGTFYLQSWFVGPLTEDCAEFVDGGLTARKITTHVNDVVIPQRLAKAYGGKPVWGNTPYAYHHHATFRTVEHAQLVLMDGAAARCCPSVQDLNASDDNRNRYEDMREVMRQVRWTSDALKDCQPVRYAAILHSRSSEERARDDFVSSFEGYFEVLAAQQVPLEFVSEKTVCEGGLQGFKVLVLPNAAYLGDSTVEAIREFVGSGGGLVATHRTGMFDEAGSRREEDWLADLAGIVRGKVVAWDMDVEYPSLDAQVPIPSIDLSPGRGYFRYFRPADETPVVEGMEGRLLNFRAPFVTVDALEATVTAARILDADQKLVNMRPYNRRGLFPGEPRTPLVTLREVEGSGRVAYVAAPLEPERNRLECYEIDRLLRNVVAWAGGPLPVETSHVPPTVQLSLNRSEDGDRLVVVLVNKTTHPLGRAPLQGGSIRYVVPVSNLELRIDTSGRRVLRVATASGQDAGLSQTDGQATLTLPELPVAEGLVLELA